MFSNKEVDTKVKYKLGIFDGREPSEEELKKVEEILISNVNAKGEIIGTDISELVKLPNLRHLDLKGFKIDESIRRIINSLPRLAALELFECSFEGPLTINTDKLKRLVFDNCGRVDLSQTVLPESVLIMDSQAVDISNFEFADKLKELGIKNCEILNAAELSKMKKLESFNADGSTLDNRDILNELRNKKISVSNSMEYHPMR